MDPISLALGVAVTIGTTAHSAQNTYAEIRDVDAFLKHVQDQTTIVKSAIDFLNPRLQRDNEKYALTLRQIVARVSELEKDTTIRNSKWKKILWSLKKRDTVRRDYRRLIDEVTTLILTVACDINQNTDAILETMNNMQVIEAATDQKLARLVEILSDKNKPLELVGTPQARLNMVHKAIGHDGDSSSWKKELSGEIPRASRLLESISRLKKPLRSRAEMDIPNKALRTVIHMVKITSLTEGPHFTYFQLSMRWIRSIAYLHMRSNGYSLSLPAISFCCRSEIPTDSLAIKACTKRDFTLLERLLASRAVGPNDISMQGKPLLYFAILGGSEECLQLLLDKSADPNIPYGKWSESVLHKAFYYGRVKMIRQLLNRKADINYISARGWSCLHYFWCPTRPSRNVAEQLEILKDNHFEFWNFQDGLGYAALHKASGTGTAADLQLLLRTNLVLIDVETKHGFWKPIHCAVVEDNVSTFRFLVQIEDPAEHNFYPDIDGWDLLHHACRTGNSTIILLLLQIGADPMTETQSTTRPEVHDELRGRVLTGYDIARTHGNMAILEEQLKKLTLKVRPPP